MFGNKKSTNDSTIQNHLGSSNKTNAINTLVASTSIEGNIKSENDIRIDGNLVGDLDCASKVIIGPQGKITGEVNCLNAVIEGKFEGNLIVKEVLTLKATAVVKANITYGTWIVSSGATFSGQSKMIKGDIPLANMNNGKKQNHKIAKRKEAITK